MTMRSEPSGPRALALQVSFRSAGSFLLAYSASLSKGSIFIESSAPAPAGTPVVLRLAVPGTSPWEVRGVVTWVRAEPGPQAAGMHIAVETPAESYGAIVDRIALAFSGIQILLATGESAPRAILTRYLKSTLTCEIADVDCRREVAGFSRELDLAVVDLDSTGARGEELLARLRKEERSADVPVVVLAERERDRLRGHDLGAEEALPNPPLFADLQAAVVRCIARPAVRPLGA